MYNWIVVVDRGMLTFSWETSELAGGLPPWDWASLDSALRMSWAVVWKVESDIVWIGAQGGGVIGTEFVDAFECLKHFGWFKTYICSDTRWQDICDVDVMTTCNHPGHGKGSPPKPTFEYFRLPTQKLIDQWRKSVIVEGIPALVTCLFRANAMHNHKRVMCSCRSRSF